MKVNLLICFGQIDVFWDEILVGCVVFVSLDYFSWLIDNKLIDFIFDVGVGVLGLEILFLVFWIVVEECGFDVVMLMVEMFCEKLVKFFGFWFEKGLIWVGGDVDFVIVSRMLQIWDV